MWMRHDEPFIYAKSIDNVHSSMEYIAPYLFRFVEWYAYCFEYVVAKMGLEMTFLALIIMFAIVMQKACDQPRTHNCPVCKHCASHGSSLSNAESEHGKTD